MIDADIVRHYRYQRRVRLIDWGHSGERSLPRARSWGLCVTPASEALAIARYRLAAARSLERHPYVSADYDWTAE